MREKLIALSIVKKGNWVEMNKILQQDRNLDLISNDAAVALVEKLNCDVVTIVDSEYPEIWHDMPKPPFVVYLKGNTSLLERPIISIIGGKVVTRYTKNSVKDILKQLPEDISIVSGLEQGVELLSSEYGKNQILCVGTGFNQDKIYKNNDAFNKVASEGLLISELPPNAKFDRSAYYRSYRLISELSHVICVFEMASFDLRLKYLSYLAEIGKEIVVLPDRKRLQTEGGLNLLSIGAKPLIGVNDVLSKLG